MKKTLTDHFRSIISVLFLVFFFTILYVQIRTYILSVKESKIAMIFAALVLIIVLVVIVLLKKYIKWVYDWFRKTISRISVPTMLLFLAVFSVATKLACIFIFQIESDRHPDIEMYWSFIRQLSTNGVITEYIGYANSYFYTVIYSLFYLPFAKLIGTGNILLFNIYLSVLFSIASLLLFDTIKYYKGKELAFTSVLLWNVLPAGMTEPLILVHENGFVFLHIITIWIFFRLVPATKNKVFKYVLVILGALVLTYATLFNKFGLIIMIAYAIVSFFQFADHKKKDIQTILSFVLPVAIILTCYLGGSYCATLLKDKIIDPGNQTNETTSESIDVPYAWGLYVGANYESHGSWTREDAQTFAKKNEFTSAEEARAYQINLVRDRYQSFLNSPLTLIHHVFNKLGSLWGGLFFPLSYDIGGPVNTFLLHWKDGIVYKIILRFLFLLNILMSIVVVLSQYRQRKEFAGEQPYITYLKLFLMGCTVAVFPFEVTVKYMSHTIFLVAILTADCFSHLFDQTDKLNA